MAPLNPFSAVLGAVDSALFGDLAPKGSAAASKPRSGPPRLALIGAGIFAREHARALKALQERGAVVVTHVYSRTAEKAEALADAFGEATMAISDDHGLGEHSALGLLLADPDVDAVDVVLPISVQPAVVMAALGAGKYVLSEKPIGPNVPAAEAVVAKARGAGALGRWGVAENYRSEPAVEALAAAKLGTVRAARLSAGAPIPEGNAYAATAWRAAPDHVGGFFGDCGTHFVAALRAAVGAEAPVKVLSATTEAEAAVPPPTAVAAVLVFPGDLLATLQVTFHPKAPKRFELVIDGDEGTATLTRSYLQPRAGNPDGYLVNIRGTERFYPFGGLDREMAAFVKAAATGSPVPPALSPGEGLSDL
eukprot:CAMPEP_0119265746 /NCGR_PEP_ID=MMETSP1329-20130426/4455_1 /TAXON_ID=114041 /ORGANISM="Genus nov. species nov., Strain RCC1024" /LENGTH=364 /DNA_ID=CAMNT_0007265595 /DNA_START=142 /DNA_END=1232 /DNA_ORIENTATION=+